MVSWWQGAPDISEVGGSGNFKVDESWGIRAGSGSRGEGPATGRRPALEENLLAQRTGNGESDSYRLTRQQIPLRKQVNSVLASAGMVRAGPGPPGSSLLQAQTERVVLRC